MNRSAFMARVAVPGLKIALIGLGLGVVAACESGGQTRDQGPSASNPSYAEEAAELFSTGSAADPGGGWAGEAAAWSIVLAKVGGDDPRAVQLVLDQAIRALGADGPWIQQRSGQAVLVYGRYAGDDLQRGRRDLKRVRSTRVNGTLPYLFSVLAPPPGEDLKGRSAEGDLRNVRSTYGKAAIYTLQIGVYGRADGQQPSAEDIAAFREVSERAVANLRRQGETAFYYHDPVRSMVTIGVFGVRDHDPSTAPATESVRLRQARERHPLNLLNGQGLRETHPTETGKRVSRMQPSRLVMIPEK